MNTHLGEITKIIGGDDDYTKEAKIDMLESVPAALMKVCAQIIDSIIGEQAATRGSAGPITENSSKIYTMRQALNNIDMGSTLFKFNAACPVRFAAECAVIQGLWKFTPHADALRTPQELLETMSYFSEARSEHWLPECKRESNEAFKWNEVLKDLPTLLHFYNCMVHCRIMEDINRKVERVARIINTVIPNLGTTKYANGSNRSMLVEMRFNIIRKYFDIKKRKGNGQKKRDAIRDRAALLSEQRNGSAGDAAENKNEAGAGGGRAAAAAAISEEVVASHTAAKAARTAAECALWPRADKIANGADACSSSSSSNSSSSSSSSSSAAAGGGKASSSRCGKAAQPARRSSVVEFTRRNNASRLAQITSGGVEALLTFKTGQTVKIQPAGPKTEDTQPYAKTYSASGMSMRRKRSLEGSDLDSSDFNFTEVAAAHTNRTNKRRAYSTASNSPTNSVLGSDYLSVRSANVVSRSGSTGSNSDYSVSVSSGYSMNNINAHMRDYDHSSAFFSHGSHSHTGVHDRSMSLGSIGQEFTEMISSNNSTRGSSSSSADARAVSPLDGYAEGDKMGGPNLSAGSSSSSSSSSGSGSSSSSSLRMRAGSLPQDLYLDMASKTGDRRSFYDKNFASPDSTVSSSTATLSLLAAAIDAATGTGTGSDASAPSGNSVDLRLSGNPLEAQAPSVTPIGADGNVTNVASASTINISPASASALVMGKKIGLHLSSESAFVGVGVGVGAGVKNSNSRVCVDAEAELEAEAEAAQAARLLRYGL